MTQGEDGNTTASQFSADSPAGTRHAIGTRYPCEDCRIAVRSARVSTTLLLSLAMVLSALVSVLATAPSGASASVGGTTKGTGLWLVATDGGVFDYGSAGFYGSTGGMSLNKPVVGMAATPSGNGYWLVGSDGGIFSYGNAGFYGSTGGMVLNKPIVAMAATPDGRGYWLVASDGGIFAYGNARFYGSTGGMVLNKPIVAMVATPDGRGYWLVASDGGIFAYGNARFYGTTNTVNRGIPIVAAAATPDGRGYWLVAADGAVFPFGDAPSYGSTGGMTLNKPIVGTDAASVVVPAQPANTPGPNIPPTLQTTDRNQHPATTTTTTTTVPSTGSPSGAMGAPAGYSASQLIFDDQFKGTSLDSSKWNPYLGAEGQRWNNWGALPSPYSGPNTPITDEGAMFAPSQVQVDNGLTLTAQRNTNQFAGAYPWLSGVVTTGNKFTLPTSGWYVQVRAKMPDQSQGMWPAIWFLCGTSCPADNELDGYEGGWVGAAPNQIMHSDFFSAQGQRQAAYDLGTDVTGWHTYGFRFLPNDSITAYVDGRQVWQVTASQGITITGEPYEIIIELQEATAETSGWHTVTNASTPAASMDVAEVQAYS